MTATAELPVHLRTAADPPAVPPAPEPERLRTAATPPAERPSTELNDERTRMIAEADQLMAHARTATLTPEQSERLEICIASAERLDGEVTTARQRERLAAQRQRSAEPTRPSIPFAPPAVHVGHGNIRGGDEAFRLWMRSHTDEPDLSADARHRAAQGGYQLGSKSVRLRCDYGGGLSRVHRREMYKGGAGLGAELIEKSWSSLITEYLTYFSPIASYVMSETTADGNDRDYFRLDDTAMVSSYTTASGGTEIAPTIPDNDIATGAVTIKCYDITSGYQKMSRQIIRDSAVALQDKVAKAISHSHARRLETDLINGSGASAPQGMLTASTSQATISIGTGLTEANMESLYFSVPIQYRKDAIFLVSDSAQQAMRQGLKDTTGKSLFGTTVIDSVEVLTLFGRPVIVSSAMPPWAAGNKPVMFVNPTFQMLRLVEGQTIDVLTEKFYPNLAYAGLMSWGSAWLGPTSANKCLTLAA